VIKDCLKTIHFSVSFSVILFGLLPLSVWATETHQFPLTPDSTSSLVAEAVDYSSQSLYFPRRGELRRCLVTSPENCVFGNQIFLTLPSVARDLSLDYRKSAFLAEISVKLARTGDYDYAKALTQVITFPFVRVSALTAIASEHTEAEQIDQAQQLLIEATQIVEAGQVEDFFRPRALTQIAVQYAAMGQSETALSLLDAALPTDSMNNSPLIFYRAEQFGEVAVGLLAVGQTAEAEQIIRQVLQEAQTEASTLPISPSLLIPLLTAGEYDFAIRLVQEVNDPTYRTRWLSEICLGLTDAGEFDRAKQLIQTLQSADVREFDRAKQSPPVIILPPSSPPRLTPPPPPLVPTAPVPLSDQVPPPLPNIPTQPPPLQLEPPQGETCSSSLLDREALVNAANYAISQMRNGDVDRAIALTQLIPAEHYKMLTLTEIAIALAEAGETEQSEQILSQALATATTVDQIANSIDYGQGLGKMQIAVRLSEAGQFTRALEITEIIEEDSYKVLTLLNIADQYIQVGEPEEARKLLVTAIDTVGTLRCTVCG
jgi:tetratricopeptide (TPR) repeat protein